MLTALRLNRPQLHVVSKLSTSSVLSSESANDGEDKRKKANAKLQDLLKKMAAEIPANEVAKIKTARPVKRVVDKRPLYKIKLDKIPDKHTRQLVAAVKDVADELGGPDVKATESELLHVILNNKRPEGKEAEGRSLNSVISDMQVEKSDDTRAKQVRRTLPRRERLETTSLRARSETPLNLFGGNALGIFPKDYVPEPSQVTLSVWDKIAAKELKLQVTHPPNNIYEEMIRWTDRGLLWKFPIDNEQGLEKEKAVDFSQHVFLDEHLADWCPTKGPIRHFMELVLVGLSKNPYITVEAKVNHIHWFRDYFESKKKLLIETGAIPTETSETEARSS